MSETLVLLGIVTCAISGVPGLFFNRSSGQTIAAILVVAGSLLGLASAGVFWFSGENLDLRFPWPAMGAEFRIGVDGLSALFLVPIFLIAALGSIYGLAYWKAADHPTNSRKLQLFYGLLPAGMALVVIAKNGLLFLASWELMALSAFFLVATEDHDREVREGSLLYLVAAHCSTLCLFGLFALLAASTGSFDLNPLADGAVSPRRMTVIFVLALLAFGLKAGVMPLHIWLPSAHTVAPSHVSAIMSGVIIKMGIYGFVRVMGLLPSPPLYWGGVVLALGGVSGILGVAYAIGQHDLKRLLAYHSIENIGIIVMGIGLALAGRSLGRTDWIVLGLAGGLLHVWNHAFFKALLFYSAGSVIHATHTREIDHLGGLMRVMPRTAVCFLVGAIAICGLPPLNGFVSEFLVYVGLFRTVDEQSGPTFGAAAFAVPAMALIGALALACFVKVFGAVFLGTARSEHANHARESPASMIGPMAILVACCAFIGIAPAAIAPVLSKAIHAWAPSLVNAPEVLTSAAPLNWISVMGLALVAGIALLGFRLSRSVRRAELAAAPTWSCGYAAPTRRMQYTSSSFAQMLVSLFAWALRPERHPPGEMALFPGSASFQSHVPDAVLDHGIRPSFRGAAWLFSRLRVFQHGSIQLRLLYVLVTLIALLLLRWKM